MFILSFFACSPSVDTFDATADDTFASTKDETPAPLPTLEGLEVAYPEDVTGYLELRPYAPSEEGWVVGAPLFMEELDGQGVFLTLPETATTPDGTAPIGPMVYAIALRAANEDGLPGIYTGLSSAELVWLPEDEGDGKAGWNVALRFGTEQVQWLDMDVAPLVTENLVGLELLTIEGDVDIPMAEGLRLLFATGSEAEHVTIWDNLIGEEWYGTLPDVPPVETITERNGMYGAMFGGWAYVDENEDGVRTTEEWAGRVYADGAPVVVSWVAPARTLQNAMAMRRNRARMGWVPYAELEDGLQPLNEDMAITIGSF